MKQDYKQIKPHSYYSVQQRCRHLVTFWSFVFLSLFLIVSWVGLSSNAWAKSNEVKIAENRVITISNRILQLLEKNKAVLKKNPAALSSLVQKEIIPFIDFDAMAKLTLGKHWRSATPQQRARFTTAYKNMLVRTYATRMLEYAGATMRPRSSVANNRPGYVTVRALVFPKNGSPIPATYELRNKSGQWKAYNVEIAGVNIVTNFRTNFTREVTAKGLDALITRLERSGR
jgi:phospholipid transport system substrate-binding protein